MIKVAITDDHPIVIDGLLNALRGVPGITVSGCYGNGAALFSGLKVAPADVLLLDLQLPDKKGNELVPLLLQQYPALHILILSGIESSPYIKETMQKGCKGYLLKKNADREGVLTAIRHVYDGGIYLDASLKEQLLHEMLTDKRKSDKLNPKITRREREVLGMIAEGMPNHTIAEKLFISLRTVETHRHNLFQKLDAKNIAGLLKIARQMGID